MKVISSHHNGGNSTNIILKDEDSQVAIVFEDKSSVLGNKITVYDSEGKEIYFLDEDLSQAYAAFNILKGANTLLTARRDDTLVHRLIKVEARGKDYHFSVMSKILQVNGKKTAKLIANNKEGSFKIELLDEENIELILTIMFAIHLLMAA